MYLIEVCANSPASALAAQQGGAHRIELCENLFIGGTTPSYGALKLTREKLSIRMHVLIRPRGGDFCYTDPEFDTLCEDIRICKELGIDGVVVGFLKPDGTFDLEKMAKVRDLAYPMSLTCHRAFDMCRDPFQALEDLIGLGYNRILTAGQKNSAPEGAELIAQLIQQAAGRIILMPGAGIRETNIVDLMKQTGATEFHVTGQKPIESPMIFRQVGVYMGGSPVVPEFSHNQTDAERIKTMVQLLNANSQ